jgi:hypothetical protein
MRSWRGIPGQCQPGTFADVGIGIRGCLNERKLAAPAAARGHRGEKARL